MNLVDIIILVFVAIAAVNGLRLGGASLIFAYGGFGLGLLGGWFLATSIAPSLVHVIKTPFIRLVLGLVLLFLPAVIVGTFGHALGLKIRRGMLNHHLGGIDAVLGSIVSVLLTLLMAWLLGLALSNSPIQPLDQQVAKSTVLRALDQSLPNLPLQGFRQLLSNQVFPLVFNNLEPVAPGSVPEASNSQINAAVNSVGTSVVEILAQGCGQLQEGSGFVVAPGLVVTNAHVVAGVNNSSILVRDSSGDHRAYSVYFDPNYDLAMLRVSRIQDPPLTLSNQLVNNGTQAVVLGYPEGGPFNAQPAAVLNEFEATGSNIYNTGNTTRAVYQIEALVRPGNSGGPLVLPNGEVVGVVFSRSTDQTNVGYALTSPDVLKEVDANLNNLTPVSNGACGAA